jgi:hypothetical protein
VQGEQSTGPSRPRKRPSYAWRFVRKWGPLVVLLVMWTAGWLVAWERTLFDRLVPESGPLVTVLENGARDARILWSTALIGLFFGLVGVLFLTFRETFAMHSVAWGRLWLVAATVFIAAGLAFPFLFPSKTFIIVDEQAANVRLDSRWLYAHSADTVRFDNLARVSLRVRNTEHRIGSKVKCLRATGLSLIREEGDALRVPFGFDDRLVASRVAAAAGVLVDLHETSEC